MFEKLCQFSFFPYKCRYVMNCVCFLHWASRTVAPQGKDLHSRNKINWYLNSHSCVTVLSLRCGRAGLGVDEYTTPYKCRHERFLHKFVISSRSALYQLCPKIFIKNDVIRVSNWSFLNIIRLTSSERDVHVQSLLSRSEWSAITIASSGECLDFVPHHVLSTTSAAILLLRHKYSVYGLGIAH